MNPTPTKKESQINFKFFMTVVPQSTTKVRCEGVYSISITKTVRIISS